MNIRDFPNLTITKGGVPISSIAATGNSDPIDLGNYVEAIVFLNSTAHAGTAPTLDCKIQYSPDKTNWADSGDSFTQITTTDGLFFKKLSAVFGRWVRLVFTIGGSASPTYTVTPSIAVKS